MNDQDLIRAGVLTPEELKDLADEADEAKVAYQIVMGVVSYRPGAESRPGKWNWVELLDVDEASFTDDGIVFENIDEADAELTRRIMAVRR